jgi:hypothetical protein
MAEVAGLLLQPALVESLMERAPQGMLAMALETVWLAVGMVLASSAWGLAAAWMVAAMQLRASEMEAVAMVADPGPWKRQLQAQQLIALLAFLLEVCKFDLFSPNQGTAHHRD